jgi:hypothetical protein
MTPLLNRRAGGGFTSLAFAFLLTSSACLPAQSLIETNAAQSLLKQGRLAGGGAVATRALANQVNDPTAPLTLIQFSDILSPTMPGQTSPGNLFQIQPVMPVFPTRLLPFEQLLKITFQLSTTPNPGSQTGLGDTSFFDLVSISQSWGKWGIGPAFVFPTATATALGQGKWQAGPAAAIIYTGAKNLTAGFTAENSISYAGDSSRPAASALSITPTLTWNLPDNWFAGHSDFNWVFNWQDRGQATIPVGLQVGRVFSLWNMPVSLSLEGAETVVKPSGTQTPDWQICVEFTLIFKTLRH